MSTESGKLSTIPGKVSTLLGKDVNLFSMDIQQKQGLRENHSTYGRVKIESCFAIKGCCTGITNNRILVQLVVIEYVGEMLTDIYFH